MVASELFFMEFILYPTGIQTPWPTNPRFPLPTQLANNFHNLFPRFHVQSVARTHQNYPDSVHGYSKLLNATACKPVPEILEPKFHIGHHFVFHVISPALSAEVHHIRTSYEHISSS